MKLIMHKLESPLKTDTYFETKTIHLLTFEKYKRKKKEILKHKIIQKL